MLLYNRTGVGVNMAKPKILIMGVGPVGLATAIGFAHSGYDVMCYDVDSTKISALNAGKAPFYEKNLQLYLDEHMSRLCFTDDVEEAFSAAQYCFVTVGTPLDANFTVDLTAFWNAVNVIIDNIKSDGVIVVKSTVPIGTNRKVESLLKKKALSHNITVVSNPEFLAQGTSVEDTLDASRIVIGGNDKKSLNEIAMLYEKCTCEKILTTPESAELIKYEANCYLAMKVSFVNDLAVACKLVGADLEAVMRGVTTDPRIGNKYFSPGLGYGGSCLTKDVVAFHHQIQKEYGHELELIEATVDINKRQCLFLCRQIVDDFGELVNRKIAVLGVAFKKNTDDVRNSLAIDNIRFLKDNGAHVTVWDPVSEENCRKIFGDSIAYEKSLKRVVAENEIVLITTDWDEVVNMSLSWLKGKSVYDGKNLFLNCDVSEMDYIYIGGKCRKKDIK